MTITELSIKRPSLIIVIFAALITIGLFSYTKLKYELLPKFSPPVRSRSPVFPMAAIETGGLLERCPQYPGLWRFHNWCRTRIRFHQIPSGGPSASWAGHWRLRWPSPLHWVQEVDPRSPDASSDQTGRTDWDSNHQSPGAVEHNCAAYPTDSWDVSTRGKSCDASHTPRES